MKFALALLALPIALAAQSPGERAMLSAWDDSLQQAPNSAEIARYDAPSRDGAGRSAEIRRGLFLVRRADLTGARADIEITLTNMQVLANHSDWAWPYFVMARGFEVMARKRWVETLSDGKVPAETHVEALWRTLRIALARDSTMLPARRMLGALTAAQGDRFLRDDQEGALRREARQPDADPDALLAWGRHLRTIREYPAALATFTQSIDRGGDRGRLQLEISRTRMATSDSAGATSEYWDGLTHLTSIGREMYRYDLSWITDSATLAEFDRTPDQSLSPWLRKFWNSRDAEAGNHAGDRLREHLRRWVVVMEKYRALSPWEDAFFTRVEFGFEYAPSDAQKLVPYELLPADQSTRRASCTRIDPAFFEQLWRMQPAHAGDLRAREPLLDHRGLIYLRHGAPQRAIEGDGAPGGGLNGGTIVRQRAIKVANAGQARGPYGVLLPWSAAELGAAPDRPTGAAGESWVYGIGGDWHVLQFRGSDALGRYAATTLTQRVPAEWLRDPRVEAMIPGMTYVQLTTRILNNLDSPMRQVDSPSCFNEARAVAAKTDADEKMLINLDTDTPAALVPSNSVMQAFALGTVEDRTAKALVSFAIASEALTRFQLAADGQSGYTIAFRVVAYDKLHDRTIELDTVRHFASAKPLAAHLFLTSYLELPLPAGDWHLAIRAEQPGGPVSLNDSRIVHVDSSAHLALSDIVTGRAGTPDWIATDGSPFPINYTNGWRAGEPAEIFYEVRGMTTGASYRTTIEIRSTDPKRAGLVKLESTERATGPVSYLRKSIGLTQLSPGRYRLSVSVEHDGARASRDREVLIVPGP